jgi:hypothetical protein
MKTARISLFLLVGTIFGCGGDPAVVPVTGTVTFQGKPLAGADVAFLPVEGGRRPIAVAVTDTEGKFALRTNFGEVSRDGAVQGEHRVTISKFVPPGGMSEDAYAALIKKDETTRASGPYNPEATLAPRIQILPPDFSDGTKTKLKATVGASGPQVIPFDLK